ncbi:hypothetical protein LINGRAHAP2_LOCUS16432 [Linum grandiflorum]
MPAESPFPSTLECTAVASLLLLSATIPNVPSQSASPPSFAKPTFDADQSLSTGTEFKRKFRGEESSNLVSSASGSSISPSDLIPAHKLRIVAVVALDSDMKLKVVRKKRSKVYWTSIDQEKEVVLGRAAKVPAKSVSTENSCLSSASSASSSSRSWYNIGGTKKTEVNSTEKWRKKQAGLTSGSKHMNHLADSILQLLSRGSSSEVRIRQVLGDSPDTSKALRMLLRREEIMRSGSGGRQDPYIYKVRS